MQDAAPVLENTFEWNPTWEGALIAFTLWVVCYIALECFRG
tara:strand:- start:2498 stop:2620 length:123 start_codon:yes stop_codon:yes gene_type:complete